jgi:hypothetical protein
VGVQTSGSLGGEVRWPLSLPGLHRQQARSLAQAVLDVVDGLDEVRAGNHGLRPRVVKHGQARALRARDSPDRERCDLDQRVLQRPLIGQQPGQADQAGSKLVIHRRPHPPARRRSAHSRER